MALKMFFDEPRDSSQPWSKKAHAKMRDDPFQPHVARVRASRRQQTGLLGRYCSFAVLGAGLLFINLSLLASKSDATQLHHAPPTYIEALQNGPTTLAQDTPFERELKGGETQSFRTRLSSGQFMEAVVEQKGIDVVVTLLGPGKKQISRSDSPNGRYGPEPLVLIAESSGDYEIEVQSTNSRAPAGRYEIRMSALREATQTDSEHVAADRAFNEGQNLRSQRSAASLQAAVEKYEQALPFYTSAKDLYRQALTLHVIGTVYTFSSKFQKALTFFGQALPLFQQIKDWRREADTLNFIGGNYDVLGDPQMALQHYNRALLLIRQGEDTSLEASVLNNIGAIYNDTGDWQRALDNFNQALLLFRVLGDQGREAIGLANIGNVHAFLAEPLKAIDYYTRALSLWRVIGNKSGEAETLKNTGAAYAQLQENHKALDFYEKSLMLRRAIGDHRGEATTLDFMGVAYAQMGELEKALDHHQQSLELRKGLGDRRNEAVTLANIGHVHSLLRQPEKAVETYTQALTIFREVHDSYYIARALEGLARAERDRGNLAEARSKLEQALPLIEQVRAKAGAQALRASYFASKQAAYELYIDLLLQSHRLEPAKGFDALALQTNERAHARSLMEMLSEAQVNVRRGVAANLIERERELEQLLNAKAQRQITLLGQKSGSEQLAQLNKEMSALEDEYEQVKAAIRKASPAYAALTQPQPLGLKEIQAQLDQGTVLLEYSLGEERSYVWAVTRDSLKTYELPKREQIEKAARLVYGLLTARSKAKAGESPPQKQERIAQTDSQLLNATRELSQMVLEPVGPELGAERLAIVADGALQYVPFSALSVVSGQSSGAHRSHANGLQTTDNGSQTSYRPLIEDHEIISLPSASALAIQRQGLLNRKPAPNAVAVIADPVFSASDERLGARTKTGAAKRVQRNVSASTRIIEHLADDSGLIIRRLKFTRQEADQILAEAPRSKNLRATDFKANRAVVTGGELSNYRYVHFATHGYIDSERPDLSAIVLSLVDEKGNPQDGFLRANEIYNLNLPAELVVLSACETGLGKEIKGEGLVGLTRGFMYAGARRVVVSLWNVNDKATAELMTRFYRGMLRENKTPAAALRTAQLEMSRQRRWQSPYYWAAFVLQGEWQ